MALHVGKGQKVVLDEQVEDSTNLNELRSKQSISDSLVPNVDTVPKKAEEGKSIVRKNKLTNIRISLGWSGFESEESSGLFSNLFKGNSNETIDLDMSVLLLDSNNKIRSNNDVVYFNNLKSSCGSVEHHGDSRYGKEKSGDNEHITIDLSKLPNHISRIVLVSTIHGSESNNKHFGLAKSAYVKVYNQANGKEMLDFDLEENYDNKFTVLLAELKKNKVGKWEFNGIGKGLKTKKLNDVRNKFI